MNYARDLMLPRLGSSFLKANGSKCLIALIGLLIRFITSLSVKTDSHEAATLGGLPMGDGAGFGDAERAYLSPAL